MKADQTESVLKRNCLSRVVRRYRKARPHCGGWWFWKEDLYREPQKLLLCEDGSEVATDYEWERATGKKASHDGYEENYWEMTETTQRMMPGFWMQCPA